MVDSITRTRTQRAQNVNTPQQVKNQYGAKTTSNQTKTYGPIPLGGNKVQSNSDTFESNNKENEIPNGSELPNTSELPNFLEKLGNGFKNLQNKFGAKNTPQDKTPSPTDNAETANAENKTENTQTQTPTNNNAETANTENKTEQVIMRRGETANTNEHSTLNEDTDKDGKGIHGDHTIATNKKGNTKNVSQNNIDVTSNEKVDPMLDADGNVKKGQSKMIELDKLNGEDEKTNADGTSNQYQRVNQQARDDGQAEFSGISFQLTSPFLLSSWNSSSVGCL